MPMPVETLVSPVPSRSSVSSICVSLVVRLIETIARAVREFQLHIRILDRDGRGEEVPHRNLHPGEDRPSSIDNIFEISAHL